MKEFLLKIIDFFVIDFIGKVNWDFLIKRDYSERNKMVEKFLELNSLVILTRRDYHLSTYLISLSSLITRRPVFWTHALLNVELEGFDYQLLEATGSGVHSSDFETVFGKCSHVALLCPKGVSLAEWRAILLKAREQLGKPYDSLFDWRDPARLSCIEFVRIALQSLPDYASRFPKFESLIARSKALTPQMLYDCEEFEVVFIR